MDARGLVMGVLALLWTGRVTHGHGRLRDPPSRSSMWRSGFGTPPNYNDNELYCGGISNQWVTNGGKCGVCGDPYQGPRLNEAGGLYANGIITRSYSAETSFNLTVEITANHKGWFEFRICATNNSKVNFTQECLDQNLLTLTRGGGTRYKIGDYNGNMTVELSLPRNLTCSFCVLQWKYHTGNNWGTDPGGSSCIGCGRQEEFYGCADVSVTRSGGSQPYSITSATTMKQNTTSTIKTITTSRTTYTKASSTILGSTSETPDAGAMLCRGVGQWKNSPGMMAWCSENCARDYCPPAYCNCQK